MKEQMKWPYMYLVGYTLVIITITVVPGEASSSGTTIRWNLVEESQPYIVIGNIKQDLMNSQYNGPSLEGVTFKFWSKPNQNLSVFVLEEKTGVVKTSPIRIDRETYCPNRLTACVVDISVGVLRNGQLESAVTLLITIIDTNDNAPKFAQEHYEVRISESERVGYRVALPVATDDDTQAFGVKQYLMTSAFSEFKLDVVRSPQGLPIPYLVLATKLKMDTTPYAISLEALDGISKTDDSKDDATDFSVFKSMKTAIHDVVGNPVLSGSTVIHVSVEDANDHAPVFSDSSITVRVREDHPLNVPLHELRATDKDHGANARISYSLSPQAERSYGDIFAVNRSNGLITLKKALDYETEKEYTFTVEAVDGGVEPMTGTQTLTIHLEDVNDNPPQLTVNILNGDSQSHSMPSGLLNVNDGNFDGISRHEARVAENSQAESFIAHLSVFDADTGRNAEVTCILTSQEDEFKLESKFVPSQYVLSTKLELDHEGRRNAYDVTVECSDGGEPSLSTRSVISVLVEDVNDNAPQFVLSSYELDVKENQPTGASLLRVKALDSDSGVNEELTYSIIEDIGELLVIDKGSGVITAASRIDYEKVKSIKFTVQAIDGGKDAVNDDLNKKNGSKNVPASPTLIRLSSTATVTINILDENDEEPRFSASYYRFSLRENNQPGHVVGYVTATDLDSPPFNTFTFDLVDSETKGVASLFSVDPRSGKIIAKVTLDRERLSYVDEQGRVRQRPDSNTGPVQRGRQADQAQYKFYVVVLDDNKRTLHSKVPVLVEILDDNDNSPVILHPSLPHNNTFKISSHSPIGHVIFETLATDADIGINAQLSYRLTGGNEAGLFSINSSNGRLVVAKDLSHIVHEKHRLRLTVADMGGIVGVGVVSREGSVVGSSQNPDHGKYEVTEVNKTQPNTEMLSNNNTSTGKSNSRRLKTRSVKQNSEEHQDSVVAHVSSFMNISVDLINGETSTERENQDGHNDYHNGRYKYVGHDDSAEMMNDQPISSPLKSSLDGSENQQQSSHLSGNMEASSRSSKLTGRSLNPEAEVIREIPKQVHIDVVIDIDSSLAYHAGVADLFTDPLGFIRENWLLLVISCTLLIILIVLVCVACLTCSRRRGARGMREERPEGADCLYNCREANDEKEREVAKMGTLRGAEMKYDTMGGLEEGPPPGYDSMRSVKSGAGGLVSGGNGSTTGTFKSKGNYYSQGPQTSRQQQQQQQQQQQLEGDTIMRGSSSNEVMALPPPLALSTLEFYSPKFQIQEKYCNNNEERGEHRLSGMTRMCPLKCTCLLCYGADPALKQSTSQIKLLADLRNDPSAYGFQNIGTLQHAQNHGNACQGNNHRIIDITPNNRNVGMFPSQLYGNDCHDNNMLDDALGFRGNGGNLANVLYDNEDNDYEIGDSSDLSADSGVVQEIDGASCRHIPRSHSRLAESYNTQPHGGFPSSQPQGGFPSSQSFNSRNPSPFGGRTHPALIFERKHQSQDRVSGKPPRSPRGAQLPCGTSPSNNSRSATPTHGIGRSLTPQNSFEDPLQKLSNLPPLVMHSYTGAGTINQGRNSQYVEPPYMEDLSVDELLNIRAQNSFSPCEFMPVLDPQLTHRNNNAVLENQGRFSPHHRMENKSNFNPYEKLKSDSFGSRSRAMSPINTTTARQDSGFVTPSDKTIPYTEAPGEFEDIENMCKISNNMKFPAHSSALRDKLKYSPDVVQSGRVS